VIPVDQTHFGVGIDGVPGNCYQACLASVLELPINEVPHFVEYEGPRDEATGSLWYFEARLWLRENVGYDLFSYDVTDEITGPSSVFSERPSDHRQHVGIGCGDSPRGDWLHAVVIDFDGNLVHDPHPSRSGVVGPISAFEVLSAPDDENVPLRRHPHPTGSEA